MIIWNNSVLIHFHIFPGKEAVQTMATVAIGEAKAKEVSVFLKNIFTLCYFQSKSLLIYYVMLHNIIKENKFCV